MIDPAIVDADVRRALAEDVGDGDRSAALIPAGRQWRASIVCREDAVVCGRPWVDAVFARLPGSVTLEWAVEEGRQVIAGAVICRMFGPARILLTGERTALNFLQLLSGTATTARAYAEAVAGTDAVVLDTRKTLPGLRQAQKYAVRCGGCRNHRMGLFDAILLKENHIMAAGSIHAAVAEARRQSPDIPVEVEVETFEELAEAIEVGVERVMLDNFSDADLVRAVDMAAARVRLEVSGNVELDRLQAIARTGVDFISTGALTKHVRAIDLSMRFDTDCQT